MKFSGKVGNGPMSKRLNLVAIRIRRVLAEVCTVPVLLVFAMAGTWRITRQYNVTVDMTGHIGSIRFPIYA